MKESFSKAQVTIRDYLFVLFHRKTYFLLPAFIVFFTATIGTFFLPKYYTSIVLILSQEEKVVNPLAERQLYMMAAPTTLAEQLKTLTEKILNYPQLYMVIKQMGLDKDVSSPLDFEKLIFSIRKKVDVKLRSPEVFEISYEDKDPQKAQVLVNNLVKNFIEYDIKKKEDLALIGVKFAESQAEVYKKKLEESEQALYDFQKKYALQRPGKDTDINISLLVNYQTQLTNIQLSLKELEKQISVLTDQLNGREPVILSYNAAENTPLIQDLNQQLKAYQMRMDNEMRTDPGSAKILEYQVAIDDLQRRLREETEKIFDGQTAQTDPLVYKQLEQNLKEAKIRKDDLKKKEAYVSNLVKEYEKRIESLPEQDQILSKLVRDTKVSSNIYEMLRLKVEENRLDAVEVQQKGTRYEILEEGRLPLKPSKPQKLVISLVALVLGIMTGLGCVFLVEMADHSFRGVEDAGKFLDIPVIGSTIKILTQEEFIYQKKKRRRNIFVVVLLILIFIIFAVVSSSVQERKLAEKIIKEQMQNEQK